MCAHRISLKIDVPSKEDGAIIIVEGIEIEITIKPTWKYMKHLQEGEEPESTVESLRRDLDFYLREIDIYEEGEKIIVKPRRYLGRDFPPIAEIIEYYGGNYVSEGGRLFHDSDQVWKNRLLGKSSNNKELFTHS
ncbi:hypothetical protein GF319_11810 [Candidatus Bathyarchaeota archaeon]|nr:hypothetical protein [Candidatus Bathyarchaeota archaeon]